MAEDVVRFLRRLRAVRDFTDQPVPEQVVDDMLEVARWSGSARNAQPWEFLVVRDRAVLRELGGLDARRVAHLTNAQLAVVLLMNGDPTMVAQETFDEGRLAERMMLVAQAHGVGGCIGWFFDEAAVRAKQLLGIPEGKLVRTAISFGYPDEAARAARPHPDEPRRPLAEIVHRERYGPRG